MNNSIRDEQLHGNRFFFLSGSNKYIIRIFGCSNSYTIKSQHKNKLFKRKNYSNLLIDLIYSPPLDHGYSS